ncbi:MAG: YjjG family noncanonical pyrimidine nucleotidase [Oscillospiraceae bacterium]|nr:YjjG family noncanonical pyrimidine nucleotidase [Oscillospiraceae bacterium]
MIEFLFLDLDDTILDFHKAERIAIAKTFRELGLEPTEEVVSRYHLINRAHWEALERKELTREQVLTGRFETLFREYSIPVDPVHCARTYEGNLSVGHYFLPGAEAAVERLSRKYKLYLASNGTKRVQEGRLKSANISRFFQQIFISQEIGVNKPDLEYFQRCFARIPNFDPARAMIVGDSLTSDIQGGINAGMRTCWVNGEGKPGNAHIRPDYEIQSLDQLEALLDTL